MKCPICKEGIIVVRCLTVEIFELDGIQSDGHYVDFGNLIDSYPHSDHVTILCDSCENVFSEKEIYDLIHKETENERT